MFLIFLTSAHRRKNLITKLSHVWYCHRCGTFGLNGKSKKITKKKFFLFKDFFHIFWLFFLNPLGKKDEIKQNKFKPGNSLMPNKCPQCNFSLQVCEQKNKKFFEIFQEFSKNLSKKKFFKNLQGNFWNFLKNFTGIFQEFFSENFLRIFWI